MQYYKANRDLYNKRIKSFIIKNAKIIKLIRDMGDCCKICGKSEPKKPWIYQFHHIDKKDKNYNISKVASQSYGKMRSEAEKCICICENCHRKLHAEENSKARSLSNKLKFLTYKNQNSCSKCGYDEHIKCLDFHHLSNKTVDISDIVTGISNYDETQIKEELDKCIVLCANCHREVHFNVELFNEKYEEILKKSYEIKDTYAIKIDHSKILKLFELGYSQARIAKELTCSESTVFNILRINELHVTIPRNEINYKLIIQLMNEGGSDNEIHKKTNVSRQVISKIRKNNFIPQYVLPKTILEKDIHKLQNIIKDINLGYSNNYIATKYNTNYRSLNYVRNKYCKDNKNKIVLKRSINPSIKNEIINYLKLGFSNKKIHKLVNKDVHLIARIKKELTTGVDTF